MTINLVDGFTLNISDPDNLLGSNQAVLITDMNYVVTLLSTYITFQKPLDLQINFAPASQNPQNTDGLMPSNPAWVNYQGQETLAAMVKGQTGVDPNGATADGGFTFYAGNDGTLKNFGKPFWFDPNPVLGQNPSIPAGQTDFIGVATHELLHCLGFASWPAVNAPWNQHTVEVNGVWYYSSPAVDNLLDGMLPLAPTTDGTAADHIGNTSISYRPIMSDLMYEFGNYAANRLDIGLLDLTILRDLGWTIQNDDSLPLVDPLDASDIAGTSGNDTIMANRSSSEILAGNGNDTIILPSATRNGDYDIDGGSGYNVVVLDRQSSDFNVVAFGNSDLLQSVTGSDGVSILKNVDVLRFDDKSVAIRTRTAADFNADGRSDFLWQNADGTPAIWDMNGTSAIGGGALPNPGSSWHLMASGDFNGDGTADIIWQNVDGTPAIWEMNGTSVIGGGTLPNPGASWHLIATGDFNDDGKADLLWQNADGRPDVWLMNGTTPVGGGPVALNPGPSWHAIGTGDFNGDGTSDILWQNADGTPAIWEMNGTSVIGGGTLANPGASWHAIGTGDFTGNGKADILWQNADGAPAIWEMNGTSVIGGGVLANPGASWHAIGTSDVNGDGKADILWQNADGTPAVWEVNGTSVIGGGVLANPGPAWQLKNPN